MAYNLPWWSADELDVSILIGRVLSDVVIERNDERDVIAFHVSDGQTYVMYHEPDCCESVYIEDICGDIKDLVGSPILMAEQSESTEQGPKDAGYDDSFTWTFYKFATVRGYVTIRWYGTSNGYYSENVEFKELPAEQ